MYIIDIAVRYTFELLSFYVLINYGITAKRVH